MKQYLSDFFKAFEYTESDTAFLMDVYDKITDNPETMALLVEALQMYADSSVPCDYKRIIDIADEIALKLQFREYTVELLIFICLSRRTKELYKERRLDDRIFKNTMLDLKYKMQECQAVKGITGTFVPEWFAGFFELTRFALGRLQFEITNFGTSFAKNGHTLTPESRVINVHIPRTLTPLDEKSCDDAFAMAKEFFKDEVERPCPFVCQSWLLYPENRTILHPCSNTLRFMNRFHIITSKVDKHNAWLWRLFDTDEKNFEKLPTDSSMRKAYAEHLKNGGKTGWGYGVFWLE